MMGQESGFRWALLVVVAITMTIVGRYRVQARAAGGSVLRREEGLLLLAMRAVVGLSFWVATPWSRELKRRSSPAAPTDGYAIRFT